MVLERAVAGRQTPHGARRRGRRPDIRPSQSYTCDRLWPGERSGHLQSAAPAGSVAPGSDHRGANLWRHAKITVRCFVHLTVSEINKIVLIEYFSSSQLLCLSQPCLKHGCRLCSDGAIIVPPDGATVYCANCTASSGFSFEDKKIQFNTSTFK